MMACASLVMAASPGAPLAAPAQDQGMSLALASPSVESDDDFLWLLSFTLTNSGSSGLYSDSLSCEIERLDPGLPEGARRSTLSLTSAIRLAATVSAGDNAVFEIRLPASADRAHLTFRYFGHRADGARLATTVIATAEPGPRARSLVSEFTSAGGQRVEYVLLAAPGDSLAPAVLYVPGDDETARTALAAMQVVRARGIAVVTMSLPGRGRSEGRADPAANAAAVAAVLDVMSRAPGVDAKALALWGVQGGAALAARVAARRHDLGALICESGCYDAACGDALEPAARSQHTPTLVLHGAGDSVASAAQAAAFAKALEAAGGSARIQTFPGIGHDLYGRSIRPATEFLLHRFRP